MRDGLALLVRVRAALDTGGAASWATAPPELDGRFAEVSWMIGSAARRGLAEGGAGLLSALEGATALAAAERYLTQEPGSALAQSLKANVLLHCFADEDGSGEDVGSSSGGAAGRLGAGARAMQLQTAAALQRHVENGLIRRPPFECRRLWRAPHPLASGPRVREALLQSYVIDRQAETSARAAGREGVRRKSFTSSAAEHAASDSDDGTARANYGPWAFAGPSVPRVPLQQMSAARFRTEHLLPGVPVLVTNVTRGWAALDAWRWEALPATFAHVPSFGGWHTAGNSCGQSFVEESFFRLHPELWAQFELPPFLSGTRCVLLHSRGLQGRQKRCSCYRSPGSLVGASSCQYFPSCSQVMMTSRTVSERGCWLPTRALWSSRMAAAARACTRTRGTMRSGTHVCTGASAGYCCPTSYGACRRRRQQR